MQGQQRASANPWPSLALSLLTRYSIGIGLNVLFLRFINLPMCLHPSGCSQETEIMPVIGTDRI